jgi:tetratricopeptide (TPR) repeat protein
MPEEADKAFAKCVYYNKTPETDPTMQLVDSGLSLARGLPDKVLDLAAKIEGVRPRLLRTHALLDLGKSKEAFDETTKILESATGATGKSCEDGNDQANIEAKILCEQARMLSNDKERTAAADALLGLARSSKSKLGRHALGVAYLSINDLVNAKEHLGQAVKDINDTSPNPFEYRTRTALAEIALAEKDLEAANKIVQEALNINSGYIPTRAVLARILVRNKETDKAEKLLTPILAEAAAKTPQVELTFAEYLVVKKDSTPKDKDKAIEILKAVKGKPGIQDDEIGRIAVMIDPDGKAKLLQALGVTAPAEPAKPGEAPQPPRRGRR